MSSLPLVPFLLSSRRLLLREN
ncbi:hypothetical protein Golax_022238 [Gossypium laxum]|uniref:Uncharacterized protein n=1 Tax=Gossypium laxum TaxID=34288 RepID=A0A7J9ANT3_9ROSI|nr:hypothetical protein [Gossypium laxum]